MEILGYVFAVLIGLFLPRFMLCIVLGVLSGGGAYWLIFIPLAIFSAIFLD